MRIDSSYNEEMEYSNKNRNTWILWFFFGIFGAHRFYTGYPLLGVLYFFTAGLSVWGWVFDGLKLLMGRYKSKDGVYLGFTNPKKSHRLTLLLWFFLGFGGIHRFYTGYGFIGVLYFATGGLLGIGWLIDGIKLLTLSYKDTNGNVIGLYSETTPEGTIIKRGQNKLLRFIIALLIFFVCSLSIMNPSTDTTHTENLDTNRPSVTKLDNIKTIKGTFRIPGVGYIDGIDSNAGLTLMNVNVWQYKGQNRGNINCYIPHGIEVNIVNVEKVSELWMFEINSNDFCSGWVSEYFLSNRKNRPVGDLYN